MDDSVRLLVGLLERDPACVGADEVDGLHGAAISSWQDLGFVGREPAANPSPTCPHCGDGVPYRLGDRLLCNRCHSDVDPRHLTLWPFDQEAFFAWLAIEMGLRGTPQRVDASLWQLGTWAKGADDVLECFFVQDRLSEDGAVRVTAYRHVLLLFGLRPPAGIDRLPGRRLSLLAILRGGIPLSVAALPPMLRDRGTVRFEPHSGALWVADRRLGEVPPGTKEFSFLAALAADLDRFVSYVDLKRSVLKKSGSTDSTEEATFCQILKSRIKKKYVPGIDQLIAVTHKKDGYRLRGSAELA